jgi:hypothetical protein
MLMPSLDELLDRWEARRREAERLGAMVPLATVAAEVLHDLAELMPDDDAPLSLAQAAQESGYSVDRLQKLVAAGTIPNAGRKGKPAIRRSDLPRKPAAPLRVAPVDGHFPARRRIVLAARTQSRGGA